VQSSSCDAIHLLSLREMRVLLIEDDPMIGKSLAVALAHAGMSVDWCRDGAAGAEALAVGGHAVVLLDLGLPKMDGLTVLEQARRNGNRAPLIVITARDGIEDRIAGLDLGADDYVVKPFDPGELLARIRAVTRRQSGQATSVLEAGGIELDLATHEVRYRGRADLLPAREFALMRALVERPGTILSRAQLEERIYGWGEEVESNAMDVLIHYVRRRFDKDVIRNVRGAGWMVAKS
jgi:two-component system OmpR family response regulator